MFDEIRNSSVIWWLLSICTFVGLPSFFFTVYSFFKNKKKVEMSALKKSRQIITIKNKKIEKLSLRYENIPIDNLSITKYAIWNSGNVEIRREDIASLKPLKIKSNGDIKILDASIIRNTDEDNGFTITHVS